MTRSLKILVCSDGFLPAHGYGGVPYSTFHLCKALIRAGASVKVLTTDRNGSERLQVATDCWSEYDGVPVWYARTVSGPFLFARSTRRVLQEQLPLVDCVINSATLWTYAGLAAWRAGRLFGKPSISYVRGLLYPRSFRFNRWRKQLAWHLWGSRILRDSSAIVALNEIERQDISNMGVTTRIEVIPNGATMSGDGAGQHREHVDKAFPSLKGKRYVLFLGRVHVNKGLDVLIPAISDVLRTSSDIEFVIAGPIDPRYAAAFHQSIRDHGLQDRCILAGPVTGGMKTALLTFAHAFVLPSYGEGLPVAVLEALLCGCPVVISRQCHLPEVEQAGAGFVVDPDRAQLAGAIRALLDDEPRRLDMGARGRALAKRAFDWDVIGARVLSLCEQVTGRTGVPLSDHTAVPGRRSA